MMTSAGMFGAANMFAANDSLMDSEELWDLLADCVIVNREVCSLSVSLLLSVSLFD
jgi:hypothetical protein